MLIARGVPNTGRHAGSSASTGEPGHAGDSAARSPSSGQPLHYAPVINAPTAEISARYLSEDERIKIADLHRAGHGVGDIAARTDRSPATISRELRKESRSGNRSVSTVRGAPPRRAATRPGRGPARSPGTLCCEASCRTGWARNGARNRSATRCVSSSPTTQNGTSCTRRSTRAVYRPDLGGLGP